MEKSFRSLKGRANRNSRIQLDREKGVTASTVACYWLIGKDLPPINARKTIVEMRNIYAGTCTVPTLNWNTVPPSNRAPISPLP